MVPCTELYYVNNYLYILKLCVYVCAAYVYSSALKIDDPDVVDMRALANVSKNLKLYIIEKLVDVCMCIHIDCCSNSKQLT